MQDIWVVRAAQEENTCFFENFQRRYFEEEVFPKAGEKFSYN